MPWPLFESSLVSSFEDSVGVALSFRSEEITMMKRMRRLVVSLCTTSALAAIAAAPARAQENLQLVPFNLLCVQPIPYLGAYYEVNGLQMMQTYCDTEEPAQRWTLVPVGGGYFHLVNAVSHMCLDNTDGSQDDRQPVQQWPCNSTSTTMQWSYGFRTNFGYVELRNRRSGKCLDVTNDSDIVGTLIQQYHCTTNSSNNNFAQLFKFDLIDEVSLINR
jgi:hypothetical protein